MYISRRLDSPRSPSPTRPTYAGHRAALAFSLFACAVISATAHAERPSQPVSVFMDSCDGRDCPLQFHFNQDMVSIPEGEVRLDGPGLVHVELTPRIEGAYHWRNTQTLVFTPVEGAINWGNEIEARVRSAIPLAGPAHRLERPYVQKVRVPQYAAAGKVARWSVRDGHPRFVAFLDDHSGLVGPGPIHALYDQPIDRKRFARLVTGMDDRGRALRVRAARRVDLDAVWPEGGVDPRHVLALEVELPRGGRGAPAVDRRGVVLSLPTWAEVDADQWVDGVALSRRALALRFTQEAFDAVRGFSSARFQEDGYWTPDAAPRAPAFVAGFDRPVRSAALRAHLEITPRPPGLGVHISPWEHKHAGSGWRYGYTVEFDGLDPGTRYRVRLRKGMPDLLGNVLEKSITARFRTVDREPELTVARNEVVLEEGHASISMRMLNVEAPTVIAYAIDEPRPTPAIFDRRCGDAIADGAVGRPVPVPAESGRIALNEMGRVTVPLPADLSGLYCVVVSARARGNQGNEDDGQRISRSSVVQITDLAATVKVGEGETLVWITRLGTGAPLPLAEVSLDGEVAFTDEHGVARLPTPDDLTHRRGSARLVALHRDDRLILRLTEGDLSDAWQFGQRAAVDSGRPFEAVAFTERGVYRPGETVHGQVIVPDAAGLFGGRPRAVGVTITDARGEPVLDTSVTLDAFGTGALTLPLDATAATGTWRLRIRPAGIETAPIDRHFLVESYRPPTFSVTLTADGDDAPWRAGTRVGAQVEARYLHGGALARRAAQFTVDRTPVPMTSDVFPGFVFGGEPGESTVPVRVADGEAQLDARGRMRVGFTVPAHRSERPQRYTVWTEVTDIDRQVGVETMSRVVHAKVAYVGTRPPDRAVIPTGTPLDVPVVAVGIDGRPRAGVRAEVTVERLVNGRARRLDADGQVHWLNHTTRKRVSSCRVRTAAVARRCTLMVSAPGRYRVRVAERGRAGRVGATVFEFSAAPPPVLAQGDDAEYDVEPAVWPRFAQDRIQIVPDKARYAPGDVARLLVESPYAQGWALVTLEREGVRSHRAVAFRGDAPTIDVPLDQADAPYVYASVVLVRGRIHDLVDGAGIETGAPGFKMGYVRLAVDPAHRRLAVKVTPAQAVAEPGAQMAVDVTVAGPDGGAVDGQAVIMVVDEAVLGLTGYRTPDPIAQISTPRPLGVRTGESRFDLPRARALRGVVSPSSGGIDDEARLDRVDLGPTDGHVRTLFRTTAFLDASVPVRDGRARVEFTLPDNLTTYRVMAVAVGAGGRLGAAEGAVTLKKALMVSPVAPRFVHPDDTLAIEAVVHNATEEDARISVTARFEGATLLDPDGSTRLGSVAGGGSRAFGFPVRVPPPDPLSGLFDQEAMRVELVLRDGDDAIVDRVRISIPVLDPGSERARVSTVALESKGRVEVTPTLPGDRRVGSGQIELKISSYRLGRLAGAVDYLMRYPHGCVEQTTSGTHPLVLLGELLPDMGVEVDPVQRKAYAVAGIERLMRFRTDSGGLSYWPGESEPHAFGTAFALNALIDARRAGFAVPSAAIDGMADYLDRYLSASTAAGGDAEAVLAILALERLGRSQVPRARRLWRTASLSFFESALLAAALNEAQAAGRGDAVLRRDVLGAVASRVREGATDEPRGADRFGSSVRDQAAALIALAGASDADLPVADLPALGERLLDALLDAQSEDRWGTTQENVFAIMAIARWHGRVNGSTVRPGTTAADPGFRIRVDGRDLPSGWGRVDTIGAHTHRLTFSEAELVELLGAESQSAPIAPIFTVDSSRSRPVVVMARSTYRADIDREGGAPIEAGFAIRRTYTTPGGRLIRAGEAIPLGSVVRVRVEVDATAAWDYVAVDDRLPAGLEPMSALLDKRGATRTSRSDARLTAGLAVLSHNEIRDSRVQFYVDEMPAGTYAFTYLARATTPGTFRRPAARVEAMYRPSAMGSTAIDTVTVSPEES